METSELNIVAIIAEQSDNILEELKSNISHDLDEFGTYFIISNKYYVAKIYFQCFNSSDIPSDVQGIILATDSSNCEALLKKYASLSPPLKFLWLTEAPESPGEIEDLAINNGFELLLPTPSSELGDKQTTFQVPLLSENDSTSRSLSLFRSLECHNWPYLSKNKANKLTFDNAFNLIKQAREDNLSSDSTKERVSRATKAILELSQFLE